MCDDGGKNERHRSPLYETLGKPVAKKKKQKKHAHMCQTTYFFLAH